MQLSSSSCLIFFWIYVFFIFSIVFPSFSLPFLPNNLTLYADAHFENNTIRLTEEIECISASVSSSSSSYAASSGFGRALYVYPIRFLDSIKNTSASFSCRFSFSIIPSPTCSFGDGLAFLITSSADSFSSSKGFFGLPRSGQDSFIAVEFDTGFDPDLGDINDNHIGIDVNNVVSLASVDAVSKGIDLKSGKQITAWIEYNDGLKLMQVWVGQLPYKPPTPLLAAQIDLSNQFKEFMHVGFSASNGQGSANHIIERWRFKTYGSYPSVSPLTTFEDGDCLLCSPEDSNNNNIDNDDKVFVNETRIKTSDIILGVGGLLASVISVGVIVSVIYFFVIKKKMVFGRRVKNEEEEEEEQIQQHNRQINRVPARFSIAEIKSATLGFHRSRIIGQGGSAIVYKGSLTSGELVAVKRFIRTNLPEETNQNPFTTEFATMVGCLRHKNLVTLEGWCCEARELILIYDYLPNGSLDKILHETRHYHDHNHSHSHHATRHPLAWKQRLNIILGVASALTYLHEECERQIIHRDVKTCNVMLDADFNPKLGDFGLAEVYEHSSVTRRATIPAGTMGYLAPEYVYSGVPSVKTDVYSFGVVVLEVATGRRPVDECGTILVDLVWGLWERGKLMEAADSRMRRRFSWVEMERVMMVGLSCVHPNHEKRPTVKVAGRMLRGEEPLPLLPSRKPMVRMWSVGVGVEDVMNSMSPGFDDMPWLTPMSHFS